MDDHLPIEGVLYKVNEYKCILSGEMRLIDKKVDKICSSIQRI